MRIKLPGDFELPEIIGKGAGSVIFKAFYKKLGRTVAVKHVQKSSPADQRYIDQVINEYEVASRLNHPNLIYVFDLIKIRWFFRLKKCLLVMEYVPGKHLSEMASTPLKNLLNIFIKAAKGIAHMHSRGFVHSDVKPSNIIVSPNNEVKVFDFGVSCPLNTERDRIQGTVDFIAPEQASKGIITIQTDIYNLGATMYRIFLGSNVPSALKALTKKDSSSYYPAMRLNTLRPDLPEQLTSLISRCCEADPRKRPRNLDIVIFELGEILDHVNV